MSAELWYASPNVLGRTYESQEALFDAVIEDTYWSFRVEENGYAYIEPDRSLPLDYVFEHPEQGNLRKDRLGLSVHDFRRWYDDEPRVQAFAYDRQLTESEAMFFVALRLASPTRPVETVLREIRACAALGLTTEMQEELDEGFVFRQSALQAENYYNNPLRTIEQSPLVKELATQVSGWANAFAARNSRDVLKAHEWQVLTAMGSVNGALLRGVLNEQVRGAGKNSAAKTSVYHPDYPLDDPSMHAFRFALYKGMHPRTDTPLYEVIDASKLRSLLPSDYKNLCVVLTGTSQLAAAMEKYERNASNRYLW